MKAKLIGDTVVAIRKGDNSMIDALIEEAAEIYQQDVDAELPRELESKFSLSPERILDLLQVFKIEAANGASITTHKILTICNLMSECMFALRYGIDRGNQSSQIIYQEFMDQFADAAPIMTFAYVSQVSQLIYEARLTISEEQQLNFASAMSMKDGENHNIRSECLALLGKFKRAKIIKSEFDLCELMLPMILLFPISVHVNIIHGLALSQKTVEASVLFLLHPQKAARMAVVELLLSLTGEKIFSGTSVRRMIVIKGWLPADERPTVDRLITQLQHNNVSPAPFPAVKIEKISASAFDGAGAQSVIISGKRLGRRRVAGLLFKIDVGIREQWIKQ